MSYACKMADITDAGVSCKKHKPSLFAEFRLGI